MQNSSQSVREQIEETQKEITKLEKHIDVFSKLCPISGTLGVLLNIAGLCFAGVITQSLTFTYLFCGLLAGGVAMLGFCIFTDIKNKKLRNKYEDAKSELHELKNELYQINQNTHTFVNENKKTNTSIKQFCTQPTSSKQNQKSDKKNEHSM